MRLANVVQLGVKELRSLARDPVMLMLMLHAFSIAIYSAATAMPEPLHKVPIAIVDEDHSPLSARLVDAFYLPYFLPPARISHVEMDTRMDAGVDTFALDIPPGFQRNVLAGRAPTLQLNVDATRVSQALSGSGYVQAILQGEVNAFLGGLREPRTIEPALEYRMRFNPELDKSWFGAVMEVVNSITMLSIVLTGAALIREREHGTIEHLLVMPVTPFEIMAAKVWSMALVVLVAASLSLAFVVRGLLEVPLAGSLPLFLGGTALHLFATTSMGIFLATLARSMPQFGLLLLLVLIPLHMLSGGVTPREAMPDAVQILMLAAPTTHYTDLAQGILFRDAGLEVVWPQFLALATIGATLVALSLLRFRRTLATLA